MISAVTLFPPRSRVHFGDPETHHPVATLPEGGSVAITAPGGVKVIGPLLVESSVAASQNLSSSSTSMP